MTGFAPAAVFALSELSAVRIGAVAVGTLRMRHRGLKVPAAMAGFAADLTVFALQREGGFVVIELRAHAGDGKMLPSAGGVA